MKKTANAIPICPEPVNRRNIILHTVKKCLELMGKNSITPLKMRTPDHCETKNTPTNDTRQAVASQTGNKPASPLNPPCMLLVEDNPVALRLLESIVTRAGCKYISAVNGERALELAKTTHFDCIVSDIALPGISGSTLTHFIRTWEQQENRPPVPIIGLTAQALNTTKEECLQSGMNTVFQKPMNFQVMQTIMNQFITHSDLPDPLQARMQLHSDLPPDEDQLFELDHFPVFDVATGLMNLGTEAVFKEVVKLLVTRAIPEDKANMQQAYAGKNWERIESLAHKMKGGAVYCGTLRMQYACQYLERCRKAGQLSLLERLYHQLIEVLDETEQSINSWLADEH